MKTTIKSTRTGVSLTVTFTALDAPSLAEVLQYAGRADLPDARANKLFGVLAAFAEFHGEDCYIQIEDARSKKARDGMTAELEASAATPRGGSDD